MLKYPNNAESLEEYYERLQRLEPVVNYEYSKKRCEESIKEWKHLNNYKSSSDINSDAVKNINDVSLYFINAWTLCSYLYGIQVARGVENSQEFKISQNEGVYEYVQDLGEDRIIDISVSLGLLSAEEKKHIKRTFGSSRHAFAHTPDYISKFKSEKASDIVDSKEDIQ